MARSAALVLFLLVGFPAGAQTPDAPEPLHLPGHILIGSARVVGLGGAYTGIAEGAAGFTSNLASLAHRSPNLDRSWDIGFTASWLDIPLTSARPRDLDNDGRADEALSSTQYLFGLSLQLGRFGIGTWHRSSGLSYCAGSAVCGETGQVRLWLQHTALGAAFAFGHEDFILGGGLYVASATFVHASHEWRLAGTGLQVDALYRPRGLPFRIGASLKPEVRGAASSVLDEAPPIPGRPLPATIVSPGVLSLGASLRLGEGSEHYNRLSPIALRALGEPSSPVVGNAGEWLLTVQLDIVAPTDPAVGLGDFTAPSPARAAMPPVGRGLTLGPRAGVEHETVAGRLRTRLGGILEPSAYEGVAPRLHVTGGAEVYLFRYYEDWALSFSFDVAHRYANVGVSLGLWR